MGRSGTQIGSLLSFPIRVISVIRGSTRLMRYARQLASATVASAASLYRELVVSALSLVSPGRRDAR